MMLSYTSVYAFVMHVCFDWAGPHMRKGPVGADHQKTPTGPCPGRSDLYVDCNTVHSFKVSSHGVQS